MRLLLHRVEESDRVDQKRQRGVEDAHQHLRESPTVRLMKPLFIIDCDTHDDSARKYDTLNAEGGVRFRSLGHGGAI